MLDQSVFWNVSIFDEHFFNGLFGEDFVFPDGTRPKWESLKWLQKEFMQWFNAERLKCILTFPVVSVSLLYQNNDFVDTDMAEFVAKEYSEGDSFFTYISDSVDSLSSCCRLKNKIQTKEFNFTNGNMGVMTGSKSVITLNLNRIVQDWYKTEKWDTIQTKDGQTITTQYTPLLDGLKKESLSKYLIEILERVYKYHTAYNELLWDLYNSGLLPAYSAGFIDLNKQYLTIGINGLTASAEFLNIPIKDCKDYQEYCQLIFSTIKEQNIKHKTKKTTYNTECIPAESCGAKLYNADKEDGYWVPKDINLYTSYIFKPYDQTMSILEKIKLHGSNYIGDFLDGGSACHINLSKHPDINQARLFLKYMAVVGCQYGTINVINSECKHCGHIEKTQFTVCPKCGSTEIDNWDRIIGYLTKIANWSDPRKKEQALRAYSDISKVKF